MVNSNIELLPHNEVAFEKLVDCLKDNQMAGINHATGTGKSFIVLKYLYENRDKRILYLAPTYPIIYQLMEEHMDELNISKDDFECFDSMIYRTLLSLNMKDLANKYDIIILDEYHRCGTLKWGKKVNELLHILKDDYPEKKVVGTTATEIRYLDNNRNMNYILFDGVEASRLTLADAILEGILPAPVYINYNNIMLNDIEKLESRVLKRIFYTCDLNESLDEIHKFKSDIQSFVVNYPYINDCLKDCKKLLVFSNQIDSIKDNQKFLEEHLSNVTHSFKVHSHQTREKNLQELKDFRNLNDDGVSVLYSIDILNEGVHVKDIDAVVMMRRTVSPIIYFQQLGRLLSYSRRNDEVVVLDLVNNIGNNSIIYSLYREVIHRAKELSKINPDKKDHYQQIIDRFRIVDYASEIYKTIDEFKNKYSFEKIIFKRLDTAVSILEGKIDTNEIEKFQAQIDILKYEEYIPVSLLSRIRRLEGITKPSIVNYSDEELLEYLGGKKNIHEKDNRSLGSINEELISFYDTNYRLPSIFGESVEEIMLAKDILNNYYKFNNKMTEFIIDSIDDSLSLLEKLTYQKKLDNINLIRLKNEVNQALKVGVDITASMYDKLLITDLDEETKTIIKDNFSKRKSKEKLIKANYDEAIYFREGFESVELKMIDELKNCAFSDYVDKTFNQIYSYINKIKRDVIYYPSGFNYDNKEKHYEQELYCKKLILHDEFEKRGYNYELDELVKKVVLEKLINTQYVKIRDVFTFMDNHHGALPSIDNEEEIEEVLLAEKYSFFKNKMHGDLQTIIEKKQKENDSYKEEVYDKYLEFLNSNHRLPSYYSDSQEEKELYLDLNRWMDNYTLDQKSVIKETTDRVDYEAKIDMLLSFVEKNRGALPSFNNQQFKHEVELAEFYEASKNDENLQDEINNIRDKYKDEKDNVLDEYVNFIIDNRRKPITYKEFDKIDSKDRIGENELKSLKDEVLLNTKVNRWMRDFSLVEKMSISRGIDKANYSLKVDELLEFVEKHRGAVPSIKNNQFEGEVELAEFFELSKNDQNVIERINNIRDSYKEEKNNVCLKYVNFIKKNKRKPMVCNASEYEMELNASLNRWIDSFSIDQCKKIKDSIEGLNNYQNLRSAYLEIKNRKTR